MSQMSFLDDILGRRYEKKSKKNIEILKFSEIVAPFGALDEDKTLKHLYRESVECFLLGFPNASMFLMVSCLERALKLKYYQVEKKKPKLTLENLLKWLEEKELSISDIDIPHGFRILRNFIAHEQKLIRESDAAEGIKYISKIMNELLPFEYLPFEYDCNNCGKKTDYTVTHEFLILGKEFHLSCGTCKTVAAPPAAYTPPSVTYKVIDLL